jgi:hypothetical protein
MCDITGNIINDCVNGAGGVKRIFVLNGPADAYSATAGNVTSITVGGSAVTSSDWFEFETPRSVSSNTEVATADVQQGTLFFQKDLTAIFNKLSVEKRNQLLLVAQSNKMIVAFEDENSEFWVMGLEKACYLTSSTATTGTAMADRSGYTVVITTQELQPAWTIDSSVVVA